MAAERHAGLLQFGDHGVVRVVFGSVEGHVLAEVGQTLLGVVLQNGTGVCDQPELDAPLRFLVDPQVIGQAVVHVHQPYIFVHRHLGLKVGLFRFLCSGHISRNLCKRCLRCCKQADK